MTRLLACADLHLGAGESLGRAPGERLAEQADVWARIVALAGELDADALLFAGDAFEGPVPTPEQYEAFVAPLRDCQIPVVAITGNGRHDAAMRSTTALDVVKAPCLTVYSGPGLHEVAGVTVAVLPWAPVTRVVAASGGGDRDEINRRTADGVVDIARGLYAQMDPGTARVLVGHWHVSSATTVNGSGAGDVFREPLLDYGALEAIGFDAIALGHNHLAQMLGERGFHAGSPMPVNWGEAESEHVVWLLDVEPGKFSAFKIPIASRRLVTLTLTSAHPTVDLDQVDGAIVKVKIHATPDEARRLDLAGYRRELLDAGAHKVWSMHVEVERSDAPHGASVDESLDDAGIFALWLDASEINGAKAEGLRARNADYLAKAGHAR